MIFWVVVVTVEDLVGLSLALSDKGQTDKWHTPCLPRYLVGTSTRYERRATPMYQVRDERCGNDPWITIKSHQDIKHSTSTTRYNPPPSSP